MKRREIVNDVVERRHAEEALDRALLEWQTLYETTARASELDRIPSDKIAWLKKRTIEIMEGK